MSVKTSRKAVEHLASEVVASLPARVQPDGQITDPSDGNAVIDALVARDIAATLRALLDRAEAAEDEAYELRLTILGGEDAPGFAGSIPLEQIKELHEKHMRTMQYRAENAERQRDAAVQAEREACAAIAEDHQTKGRYRVDFTHDAYISSLQIAHAIRARGGKGGTQ